MTDLVTFYKAAFSAHMERAAGVVWLDFSKVLDSLPQPAPGQTGETHTRQVVYKTSRELAHGSCSEVIINGFHSSWQPVTSRDPGD